MSALKQNKDMRQKLQVTRQSKSQPSYFIYKYFRKSTESSNFDWRSDDSSDYGKLKLVADKNRRNHYVRL